MRKNIDIPEEIVKDLKKMAIDADQEILEIDFYDLCGCAALWMSDEDKIKYYRECMNTPCSTDR